MLLSTFFASVRPAPLLTRIALTVMGASCLLVGTARVCWAAEPPVAGIDIADVEAYQAAKAAQQAKLEPGFTRIFNGRDLQGWNGNQELFRVQDQAIVGGTMKSKIPHNEFLTFGQSYDDFELRLQAKLLGKGGNAGIQIRSRRVPEGHKNPHEMIGYQVDMGKAWNQIWWGKLYDETRRNKVLAGPEDTEKLEKLVRWDDWNDYRIRCEGDRIQIWLNGTQTVDFREPDAKIARQGIIGLQIHGGPPSEAWYRNIRIRKLPK